MILPVGEETSAIRVLAETPSTFSAAFAAIPPLAEWHSVLAKTQTSGVGQLGRTWLSPPGNLYVSVRLPAVAPFTGTAAAPAVGGLLAQALRKLGVPVLVKWPNDLVLAGCAGDTAVLRKVGGILIQERGNVILAGVGLNIDFAPEDSQLRAQAALPAGVLPAALLRAAGVESLCDLWQRLVAHVRQSTGSGCENGAHDMPPAVWQTALHEALAFRGEMVFVRDDNLVQGRLVRVNEQGGLVLRTADGETPLYSGSLQVRGENLE